MNKNIKKPLGIILAAIILNEFALHDIRTFELCITKDNTVAAADAFEVDSILGNVLFQMANTVTEPAFGTNFGEWSVLCLARGGFYTTDDKYFLDYYDRIVETVNTTAASVNKNGALHKAKSTENSRLILALSAIGKNAENVGDWNLISPYDDFNWIKKQGINGPIFTLIALDTMEYQTSDPTIRQQCLDFILEHQLDDGGWALTGNLSDPDITAMTLQALSRYTYNEVISAAVESGISCLSQMQMDNGGYSSWGTVNSESIAQVITACTSLGIDPNTDERFIKNGISAVDAILEFYNAESMTFSHIIDDGGDAMATDQAAYALVSYKRFINGENSLYDMSDVFYNDVQTPDDNNSGSSEDDNTQNDNSTENDENQSVNEQDTTSNNNIQNYATNNQIRTQSNINSVRTTTQSTYTTTKKIQTTTVTPTVTLKTTVVTESEDKLTFSAVCLYNGDDIDIIPSSKMAVAVAITGLDSEVEIKYSDETYSTDFMYNELASNSTGKSIYIAIVDSNIDMKNFTKSENYTLNKSVSGKNIVFGDVNEDGVINAQDALYIVDLWMGQRSLTDGQQILRCDINADGRINTLDASAISEFFVSGVDFEVIEKINEFLGEK